MELEALAEAADVADDGDDGVGAGYENAPAVVVVAVEALDGNRAVFVRRQNKLYFLRLTHDFAQSSLVATDVDFRSFDDVVGNDGGDECAAEGLVEEGVLHFELADGATKRLVFHAVNGDYVAARRAESLL